MTLERPKVTVIVLTYNDPVFTRAAVQSVIGQTYTNLKIKLLDNGSTDDTPEVLREFENDPRVEIIRNPINQRSEFATRVALETDTEYLSLLFSDDLWMPNRIECMIQRLEADSNLAAVFSNNCYLDEKGKPLEKVRTTHFSGDISQHSAEDHLRFFFLNGNSLHPCSMLIRTAEYKALGGFAPYLHRIGDMTFFARLLADRPVGFVSDVVQKITIWTSGRNESIGNLNGLGIYFERLQFLQAYRHPEILDRVEKIFPELADKMPRNACQNVRLFWMGRVALQVNSIDYNLFGMKCLYDAFAQSPTEIDAVCQQHFGETFSQLSYHSYRLLGRSVSPAHQWVARVKATLASRPLLRPLISILRPFMQIIRAVANA
jgi:glycosyltransferase involved in cell wall biosynthesis